MLQRLHQPEPIAQLAAAGHRRSLERGQQIERFRSGEFRVQAQFTRQVPQVRGQPAVIGDRVRPEHPHVSVAGTEQAGETSQRGRLPRAVRAEEAEHLTWSHREAQAVDAHHRPVTHGSSLSPMPEARPLTRGRRP
ncbi:hypothetical protein NC490_42380 [Streptomyces sp. G1]|nr:hypothetical protein [Streptomyces sp. G1]MCM1972949.1 hypothetical protein [Streptomyces sp. G1]